MSGPVLFIFEKVSTFIVTEDKEKEAAAAPSTGEVGSEKEKEIVIQEEKKEEVATEAAEPAKVEEAGAGSTKP